MKVFLGGTCGDSTWRQEIIPMLNINYFNPIVDDWDEKAQANELYERKKCDFVLYVITPEMEGVYSIAEVVDDSNKQPEKTIFCVYTKDLSKVFSDNQLTSLMSVGKMIKRNGGLFFEDIKDVANYLNNADVTQLVE